MKKALLSLIDVPADKAADSTCIKRKH